jgi:mono/diheme cytochrome c family protein
MKLPFNAESAEARRGKTGTSFKFSANLCGLCVESVFVVALIALLAGCRQDMQDQPKYRPFRKSTFFGDERSARPQVAGTVGRGQLHEDSLMFSGKSGAAFADTFPLPVDEPLLRRGQERYRIYCSPCHGLLGRGDGMVVRRGYRPPSSFHVERLRAQPAGYFFDAISHGFGAMPDYAAQIAVKDRWAIVAYVRALQLSQNVPVADVPADKRAELEKGAETP